MNVYYCKDHDGHWPVGACSIIVAGNPAQARDLLEAALRAEGLETTDFTIQAVDLNVPRATILLNGDY